MLNILHLKNIPIWEQLQIEEALIRLDDQNWCILNEGSPKAIVMGISGIVEELVHVDLAMKHQVPILRRFSGGGTVIVDENTVFVSFIYQKSFHNFPPFPEKILQWTERFYQQALRMPEFKLQENDYTLNNLKCGGNAQYLRKDRWLHHSTLLWDFHDDNMKYLLHPKKTPKYRLDRTHLDFLCRLNAHFPSKEEMMHKIIHELQKHQSIKIVSINEVSSLLLAPHRKATERIL